MWTRPIWSGLLKWRLAKGKSIWPQLRSDAEYSWLNLGWSIENTTQNAQRIQQWDGEAESTPAGNAAELNQALKRVEEKDIEKSFHCVLLCCVLLLKRIGMKSISSRIKRRVEVYGEKTMWLSVFHLIFSVWNVERIGSGTMWMWMLNPCIPH